MNFRVWNLRLGWFAFAVSLVTYLLTVEPTASYWDCSEYIATAAKLQVGHLPGAPFFKWLSGICPPRSKRRIHRPISQYDVGIGE